MPLALWTVLGQFSCKRVVIIVAVANVQNATFGGRCEFTFTVRTSITTGSNDSAYGNDEVEVTCYFSLQPKIGDPLAG